MGFFSHYTQSKAAANLYEPVHSNLFEVSVISPVNPDVELTLQHVKSIGGLQGVNPSIDAVGQKFKQADASYAGMPAQTFVDLSVVFTLNLNDANQMYLYKQMKEWYAQIYDPATGETGIKKDYVGTLIVVQFNRKGDIFRQITFKDVFPTGQLEALDSLDYETSDPAELTMTFRSDHWVESLA